MFVNGLQKDLILHLPRDQGEADWPVLLQILLFALLVHESDLLSSGYQELLLIAMAFYR